MTDPTSAALPAALTTLLDELLDGAAADTCWVLNRSDPGLLRSVDGLSADAASAIAAGGRSSIAAHVDHLAYGLSLLNRWSAGEENPFATADFSASWRRTRVTDGEWKALRVRLRDEARRWQSTVPLADGLGEFELTGLIASVVHLAYHLGAMRQMDRSLRGPPAED